MRTPCVDAVLGRGNGGPRKLDLATGLQRYLRLVTGQRDDVLVFKVRRIALGVKRSHQFGDARRPFVGHGRPIGTHADFLLLNADPPRPGRLGGAVKIQNELLL